MARIRTIKPEFWTDETLTECSLSARLLFIGTWSFADDKGNLEHSWKQLKMKVFPADEVKVLSLLNELITHGLLIEYSVSDKKYLHIKGFEKHQVINRPSSSNIPAFNDSLIIHGALTEDSLREGKGREGKGRENPEAQSADKKGNGEDLTPVVERIPLNDGSEYAVHQSLVTEFDRLYPAVDVAQTLREIRGWCLTNPTKRKTISGVGRFMSSWLSKEQDKHGG